MLPNLGKEVVGWRVACRGGAWWGGTALGQDGRGKPQALCRSDCKQAWHVSDSRVDMAVCYGQLPLLGSGFRVYDSCP